MSRLPENKTAPLEGKTLLNLVEQSFSVKGLSETQASEILRNMFAEEPEAVSDLPLPQHSGTVKVYFTHDIDWLDPLHPYSILKALNPYAHWVRLSALADRRLFVRNMERLLDFEDQHGTGSIFLCGAATHTMGRYDLRYRASHPFLREVVDLLSGHGNSIGLHSHYRESITGQRKKLEALTGEPVLYHRSHFLRFKNLLLHQELEKEQLRVDFSQGHARRVGFNDKVSRHYKAIDVVNKKVLNLTIVPTVLFDNAFFFQAADHVFSQFRQTISEAKKNNSAVAVLFHPENMLIRPELWEYYKEIIHICRTEQAIINPLPETL